jgi:hypothetical protein
LAVDSGGMVYVADAGQNRIRKYTSDGQFISNIGQQFPEGTSESCARASEVFGFVDFAGENACSCE